MPYVGFDNVKHIQHKDCCTKCIHKIYISKNLCRCSISNNFIFNNQILNERCTYIDEIINKNRKVIFGIFTYGNNAEIQWTGMLTYGNVINKNDNEVIIELFNIGKNDIYKQYPQLKKIPLMYCLIGESINGKKFETVGNLIANNILKDIIEDANNNFM